VRILLPTMRDPGQIGGTTTHIDMLTRGLEALGHEARALYLSATMPALVRKAGLIWPAGALNRMRTGWGMMYAAEARARLLASATERALARAGSAAPQGTPAEGTAAAGDGAATLEGAATAKGPAPWEVLNAQEVYSVPYLRAVADKHGLPLVLTLHGYALYESVSEGYSAGSKMGHHYLMRAEMRALRLADAVVTVDTRLYRHALALVPERSDTIYTLMNFLDTGAFAPPADPAEDERLRGEARASWGIPEGKIVLFCPRRLVKKNGVIYPSLALAAMEPADRDRFLLLHAGEGGERGEMERIIRENRLGENVRLLGGQGPEAIRALYRLADIVLVPSVHSENVEEATSLSALEAMAAGRPLIAGNVGGLAEMVVDGETGLLVPADAKALAAAILRLAAAPDLGARLAAAARAYVEKNHSHIRAAEAYVEVYRRAAERVAGRGTASRPEVAPAGAAPAGGHVAGPVTGALPAMAPGTGASDAAPSAVLAEAQPGATPPPPWPSVSVLGFPLDVVTLEQAAQWVIAAATRPAAAPLASEAPDATERAARTGRTALAVSFNPELVMRAQDDPAAAEVLWEAGLSYPDGVGAAWAAGRQGARQTAEVRAGSAPGDATAKPVPAKPTRSPQTGPERVAARQVAPARGTLERVAGIDLAQRVLELAVERGLSVYFLGASEGVAEEAARRQTARLPGLKVAGTHHGYFSPAEDGPVVEAVRASGADILLVAMGAPRQELFLLRHRDRLGAAVGLGVGGSFDVWAGKVKRAPEWTQRARVEWLYRLASDPQRLRRQAVLPRFAAQVLRWSPEDYGPPRRGRSRIIEAGGVQRDGDRRGGD
jgi:exopolysaccharide biosynthesis WecB/TagA/CpsF family protein